jgi:uncharacterized membrane protein YagU involved in acid resistance
LNRAAVATRFSVLSGRVGPALLGGLAGGVAFGLLMQVTDIMLTVAALVASTSTTVGWIVHLAISLVFGVVYAMLFGRWIEGTGSAVLVGAVYGWAWWVGGGMIVMPAWLGREDLIFRFTATAWQSLAGHLIYGLLLGLVYGAVRTRLDRRADGVQRGHEPVHR